MHRVHQFSQELRLKRMMQKVSILQQDIQRTSLLVPKDMEHFKLNR